MKPGFRRALRPWIPPAVVQWARDWRGVDNRFDGPFASWADALSCSSSYDDEAIVERVLAAAIQVRDGRAVYERDAVLFDRVEYSFPLLAVLLRAALEGGGGLTVVDFGGSLGSSYRECRPFLGASVCPLRWYVVEQARFVDAGRKEMANHELQFFYSLQEAARSQPVDAVVFSSVLQYLPDPHDAIAQAVALDPRYLVIDRTIVSDQREHVAYVQSVPAAVYQASYPVWSLSRRRMLEQAERGFELLSEHPSLAFPALAAIGAEFRGFVFRNKRYR